jgi:hypothetical protein
VLRLFHQGGNGPAPECASYFGDDAESAGVITSFRYLHVGGIARRGKQAWGVVIVEVEIRVTPAEGIRRACFLSGNGAADLFDLIRAQYGIDFYQVRLDFLRVAFRETTGDNQPFAGTGQLQLRRLKNGVDGFLLGALDETTGVDHDHVGFRPIRGQGVSFLLQQSQHDLAIDEVLGTSQADESYLSHRLAPEAPK